MQGPWFKPRPPQQKKKLKCTIEKKKLLLHWKLKVTFILKHFFLAKTTLILNGGSMIHYFYQLRLSSQIPNDTMLLYQLE